MCNNFYILRHNFGFSPTRLTPFCCGYAPKALKGAVNALYSLYHGSTPKSASKSVSSSPTL